MKSQKGMLLQSDLGLHVYAFWQATSVRDLEYSS